MSSDTAKENASVVDSSLTDWKQDIGNSDDPGKLLSISFYFSHFSCPLLSLEICVFILFVLFLLCLWK